MMWEGGNIQLAARFSPNGGVENSVTTYSVEALTSVVLRVRSAADVADIENNCYI